MAQTVKNLPAMWGTQVQFLGQEDLLQKETETHSSMLAWKIPWTEESGGLQSMGCKESNATEQLTLHFNEWDKRTDILLNANKEVFFLSLLNVPISPGLLLLS